MSFSVVVCIISDKIVRVFLLHFSPFEVMRKEQGGDDNDWKITMKVGDDVSMYTHIHVFGLRLSPSMYSSLSVFSFSFFFKNCVCISASYVL